MAGAALGLALALLAAPAPARALRSHGDVASLGDKKVFNGSADGHLAERESFGFFQEPDEMWRMRKKVHARQMQLERASRKLQENTKFGRVWFQWHYEPSFHCDFAERIGPPGDGGKWVCNPSTLQARVERGSPCLVYSVGSHGDFGFEEGVLESISRRCEVHASTRSRRAPGRRRQVSTTTATPSRRPWAG